jgi:hypothetical protein
VRESLGWVATGLVVGSYFCARPERLRALQVVGAVVWTIYGLLIGSLPVVVANVLVFSAALWTIKGDKGFTRRASKSTARRL